MEHKLCSTCEVRFNLAKGCTPETNIVLKTVKKSAVVDRVELSTQVSSTSIELVFVSKAKRI